MSLSVELTPDGAPRGRSPRPLRVSGRPQRRDRAAARLGRIGVCLAAAALVSAEEVRAHAIGSDAETASLAWTAVIAAALLLSALFYGRGLHRLWSRAAAGAGVRRWQAAAFALGWASIGLALLSPLDAWGEELFSMHMVQHEILMLVSAPLVVLGRPGIVTLWAFGREGRRGIGRTLGNRRWRQFWRRFTSPFVAWSLFAVMLWGWHAPVLFDAAIVNVNIHVLQHASFLGASLLFWGTFLGGGRSRTGAGVAAIGIVTTAVHSALLGAILTLSPTAWYAPYLDTTADWGLTPLEDQQLGGLIMWVPGAIVPLIAVLAVVARLTQEASPRTTQRTKSAGSPRRQA